MDVSKILEIIKCPYCPNENLTLENECLLCHNCQSSFPIIGGVPVLLKKDRLCGQEKQQAEWFNKHYSQFSKKEYKLENWRLSMLNRIFDVPFKKEIKSYLDIGCGATGYTVIEAAKRNSWFSIGVDISVEAMVRAKNLAKNRGVDDITVFLVCSAENLPFKSHSLDYISAVSLLEHLCDDEKAISNLSKTLKKDGRIYICVPNAYKRMWPFLWPVYLYIDRKIGHKRHYSIENLSKKMKINAGLELEKVFYNGHLIKLCQLVFEKIHLIDTEKWWFMERKDINENNRGIQLNAIYRRS